MMRPAATVALLVLHVVLAAVTWSGFAAMGAMPGFTSSAPIFMQKIMTFLRLVLPFMQVV